MICPACTLLTKVFLRNTDYINDCDARTSPDLAGYRHKELHLVKAGGMRARKAGGVQCAIKHFAVDCQVRYTSERHASTHGGDRETKGRGGKNFGYPRTPPGNSL